MKRDIMRLNVPEQKITHIYNGVDNQLFQPTRNKKIEHDDVFELIHIGRYSPEKGQGLILDVLKELRDHNYKCHLTMIGFGHKILRNNVIGHKIQEEILTEIKEKKLEKFVTLVGFIDHDKIPQYLEKAHIFLQPSLS